MLQARTKGDPPINFVYRNLYDKIKREYESQPQHIYQMEYGYALRGKCISDEDDKLADSSF